MRAEFITAHEMQMEARDLLGWEASDADVTLAAIVLTCRRRGLDDAQTCRLLAVVDYLHGDLFDNLALQLDACVAVANDERAQQQRKA